MRIGQEILAEASLSEATKIDKAVWEYFDVEKKDIEAVVRKMKSELRAFPGAESEGFPSVRRNQDLLSAVLAGHHLGLGGCRAS